MFLALLLFWNHWTDAAQKHLYIENKNHTCNRLHSAQKYTLQLLVKFLCTDFFVEITDIAHFCAECCDQRFGGTKIKWTRLSDAVNGNLNSRKYNEFSLQILFTKGFDFNNMLKRNRHIGICWKRANSKHSCPNKKRPLWIEKPT